MTAPSLPVVGTQFAERFYIERLAGQGGMGAVFQARDRKSGSPVALKVLHADAADPLEAKRFTAEAQTLAALHHPGIVRYISHGVSPAGQQFLAMEWLEGEDLNKRLARGPLSVRDSLRLIQYVASALAVAHQQGIVHRDLKPSKVTPERNQTSNDPQRFEVLANQGFSARRPGPTVACFAGASRTANEAGAARADCRPHLAG